MTESPQSENPSRAETPSSEDAELAFTNTPNLLTLLRILFVPIVVGALFFKDHNWDIAAAILFGIAAVTDYFDGYIARARKQVTVYGKLMDPLADKFLVVSSLIMLQHLDRIHPVVVMLLICRELAITGLRALASAEGVIISASDSAKLKTVTQMVAIPFLMVQAHEGPGLWGIPFYWLGTALLYASLAISLWSAKDYVVGFFKGLKDTARTRNKLRGLAREARRLSREARFVARARRARNSEPPKT